MKISITLQNCVRSTSSKQVSDYFESYNSQNRHRCILYVEYFKMPQNIQTVQIETVEHYISETE